MLAADIVGTVLLIALGLALVARTLLSALRTFVVPRAAEDRITRMTFDSIRAIFEALAPASRSYPYRDRLMAYYAPLCLIILPFIWLTLILIGYTAIFLGVGEPSLGNAFRMSGSSLMTLGFAAAPNTLEALIAFSEAGFGLLFLALLISYLPMMHGSFTRREILVNRTEVRAGSPPSAVVIFERYARLGRLDKLSEIWTAWEPWFAEVEETHTTIPPLAFYRSPTPDRSWITAAGTVLDAAALARAALDLPTDTQADLTIRAGYLALRPICDFFGIGYDPDPAPDAPISVTRAMFDEALDEMAAAGVPIKADRDEAYAVFNGWRVNYDRPLLALSALVVAPEARWNTEAERGPVRAHPLPRVRRPRPT